MVQRLSSSWQVEDYESFKLDQLEKALKSQKLIHFDLEELSRSTEVKSTKS